eukprot:g6007.t1
MEAVPLPLSTIPLNANNESVKTNKIQTKKKPVKESEVQVRKSANNKPSSSSPNKVQVFPISVETPKGKMIHLDGVALTDSVLGLRELLCEVPLTCKYTVYNFALIAKEDKERLSTLNEYTELSSYDELMQGTAFIRMEPENYNAHTARVHVQRLREVLKNPPVLPQGVSIGTREKVLKGENGETEKKLSVMSLSFTASELKEEHCFPVSKSDLSCSGIASSLDLSVVAADSVAAMDFGANSLYTTRSTMNSKAQLWKLKSLFKPEKDDEVSAANEEVKKCRKHVKKCKIDPDSDCIKAIRFSGWNPPPMPRRLVGDLFYLEIHTLENKVLHVTATASGFFLNQSSIGKNMKKFTFNPLPSDPFTHCTTLMDLLLKTSPLFCKHYQARANAASLQVQNNDIDPTFLSTPWQTASLSRLPISRFGRHWCRSLEQETKDKEAMRALYIDYKTTKGGAKWSEVERSGHKHSYDTSRSSFTADETRFDWNEEYQACCEMPRNTLQERIFRSRGIMKVQLDFQDAAVRGAKMIIEGNVQAMNPMDEEMARVFVHNNIFFSYASDARGIYKDKGGDEAAHKAASCDLVGVKLLNKADIPGLSTLLTAVIDWLGVRLVAQAIIPGILQGEAASSLVYGSVDNGNTMFWSKEMHEIAGKLAKQLHLSESFVKPSGTSENSENENISGKEEYKVGPEGVKMWGAIDMKGILGSDGRHYLLEVQRVTPRDANMKDDNLALLRPELIQQYGREQEERGKRRGQEYAKKKAALLAKKKKKELSKEEMDELGDAPAPPEKFVVDVNALTDFASYSDEEEKKRKVRWVMPVKIRPVEDLQTSLLKNDAEKMCEDIFSIFESFTNLLTYAQEEKIKKISEEIPLRICKLLENLQGTVIDGEALCAGMHRHGINLRYLGKFAKEAAKREMHFLEMAEIEMVVRVLKKKFSALFVKHPTLRTCPAPVIVAFFNALFGEKKVNRKPGRKEKKKTKEPLKEPAVENVLRILRKRKLIQSTEEFWKKIQVLVETKYDWKGNLEKMKNGNLRIPFLRRICQLFGVTLRARNYNASKFVLEDVLDVFPVVKSAIPSSSLAEVTELLMRGKINLHSGKIKEAYQIVQYALQLLYQVEGCGIEAGRASQLLALIFSRAGSPDAAVLQARRALAIFERVSGVDSMETAHAHASLSSFLQAAGKTKSAIRYLRRAIGLYATSCGHFHALSSSLYLRLGQLYGTSYPQHSLWCMRNAVKLANNRRAPLCAALVALSIFYSQMNSYKTSVHFAKEAYLVNKRTLGENHQLTKASEAFMKKIIERNVNTAKGIGEKKKEQK